MHPPYYVSEQSIVGGAARRSILRKLLTPDADIAKEDCTLVFCMLNEASGDSITTISETSSAGQDIIDLCQHLLTCNRPMRAAGESSDVGKYNNSAWVHMVSKMVTMARSMGIPTITGKRCLRLYDGK